MSEKTFRLQGISADCTREAVEQLVKESFDLDDNSAVRVRSLAKSVYRDDEQVATLEVSPPPSALLKDSACEEWTSQGPSSYRDSETSVYLTLDTHFEGLTPLYTPENSQWARDVVAVSGLGGHAFGSFKEKGGRFMWLRDALPRDFPGSRIFVYGSNTTLQNSASIQNISHLGHTLRTELRFIRDHKIGQPLVLIGHSLGGILVKEAVIQMQHGSTEDKENLASIQGLVFFGVPNRGMEVASFVSMVGDNPNRFLLEVLRTTSGVMQRQSNEFQSTFTTKRASIYSVFETMLSPTAQLDQSGQYKMTGPPALLVGEDSAKCGRSWESDAKYAFAINRTHSELVKFRGPHDKEYAKVSRCLKSLTPRVGHKAEKHIKRILSALEFPEMEHRLHGIEKAHAQTFAWLLAKPCDSPDEHCDSSDERRRESARNSFLNWFKAANKEPIFWITGKPASGKSTLMKYIYHKDELRALLRSWALRRDPILVGHFFFDRGLSPLQKSRNGLFRSLLHQILSQRRDLVPIVFESYMKQSKLRPNKPIVVDVEHAKLEFTWNDLTAAFEKTIEIITSTEHLCIFVDGLDEYRKINDTESYATYLSEVPKNHQDVEVAPKGHKELCKMFKDLGRFPNLKICLASRPLNAFEDAFDVYSQLRLHDLSYHDIRTFVRDGLESHPLLLLVHVHSRDMEKDLIDTISNNAAGVFLWVKIVVQNVLDGLDERNFLNFNEIIRMIQSLPVELGGPEGLYMRMLRDVPSQHRAEGVNLLNIMLAAHNKELDLTSTTLQYTQWAAEDAIRQPIQKLSSEQMENAKVLSDGHIKSRCRGLIEERYDSMEFLHQTVKEFVETIMEWDEVKAWGDEERMKETNVPLLISTLLEIKLMIAMEDHRADLIRQMLSLAFHAEHTTGVSQTALLDDLDSKMQSSWGLTVENALENPQAQAVIQNSSWTTWFRWIENPFMEYSPLAPVWHKEGFYQLAILAGLRGYVHQKIKDGLIGLDLDWGEPILAFALFPWEIDPQPDLVSLIIDNGGDPQAKMLCGNTAWQRFIADLAFTSFPHSDEMIEIVILLLRAGADVASWGISTPGSAKDSVVQSSPAFEIIEFFSHHDLDILPLLIALVDAGALLLEDEEQMLRISLTPKQLQEVESLGRFQKTPDMVKFEETYRRSKRDTSWSHRISGTLKFRQYLEELCAQMDLGRIASPLQPGTSTSSSSHGFPRGFMTTSKRRTRRQGSTGDKAHLNKKLG